MQHDNMIQYPFYLDMLHKRVFIGRATAGIAIT